MAPVQVPHTPAEQVCVPLRQAPTSVPQGCVSDSSTLLSQSSSLLLQVSATGPTEPAQVVHWPETQVCVPATHSPVSVPQPRVEPSMQLQPSSTRPSQLSSRPLQVSVVGLIAPTQVPQAPAVQVCVPLWHTPVSMPHGCVRSSSTIPSQSSSMLLHFSATAVMPPMHAPYAPPVHIDCPTAQAPTSVPQLRLVPLS